MNKLHSRQAILLAIAALALAWPAAQAASISKSDYSAGKTRIGADYKTAESACAPLTANAKDICIAQAKAAEKAARADLEYSYSGKAADATKAQVAKAEGAYAVAKEKCDDLKGNDKDVCVKEAKAVEVKALADAKLGKKVAAAGADAAADVRDADYKVAVEKCDALGSDAKTACVTAAKAKFGKS